MATRPRRSPCGLEGAGLVEGRAGGNRRGREIDHRLQPRCRAAAARRAAPLKGFASIAAREREAEAAGIGQHGGEQRRAGAGRARAAYRSPRYRRGHGRRGACSARRRAGGHAGQAGEAAVDVLDHFRRGRLPALQHVLDQVDAPARRIEFVAEQEVGRAGGGAEAAMDAGAENPLRTGHGGIAELIGREIGLHDVNSQRPSASG